MDRQAPKQVRLGMWKLFLDKVTVQQNNERKKYITLLDRKCAHSQVCAIYAAFGCNPYYPKKISGDHPCYLSWGDWNRCLHCEAMRSNVAFCYSALLLSMTVDKEENVLFLDGLRLIIYVIIDDWQKLSFTGLICYFIGHCWCWHTERYCARFCIALLHCVKHFSAMRIRDWSLCLKVYNHW